MAIRRLLDADGLKCLADNVGIPMTKSEDTPGLQHDYLLFFKPFERFPKLFLEKVGAEADFLEDCFRVF